MSTDNAQQPHDDVHGPVAFNEGSEAAFARVLTRYPTSRAALLPALYIAQEQFGYLSPAVLDYVAGRLELPAGKVLQVATFYTMFHKKPAGRYHIEVCTSVPCCMLGAFEVLRHIEAKLGIRPGEVTPDRRFSLQQSECLAGCGHAPLMQINSEYHEHLTPERIDAILDALDQA
jgi:NADH-quinone oxidoreductase subunit E